MGGERMNGDDISGCGCRVEINEDSNRTWLEACPMHIKWMQEQSTKAAKAARYATAVVCLSLLQDYRQRVASLEKALQQIVNIGEP